MSSMTQKPTGAIVYCRVSSLQQSNFSDGCVSLQAQENVCREYCNRNKIPVVQSIHEVQSGRDMTKLKLLNRAVRKLAPGTVIVFYNITRFSRNVLQGLNLLNLIAKKQGSVYAVNEKCDYSESAQQHLFRNTLCFAQNESDQISQRVKNSVVFRRKRGDHFGVAPYGKMVVRGKDMRRMLAACSAELEVVKVIQKMFRNKILPLDIALDLNAKGILRRNRLWTKAQIISVLAQKNVLTVRDMKREINNVELSSGLDDLLMEVTKRGAAYMETQTPAPEQEEDSTSTTVSSDDSSDSDGPSVPRSKRAKRPIERFSS